MVRMLDRKEAAAFIETLDVVKDAPEQARAKWCSKDGWRRYAKGFDYVELDDGTVVRFAKPHVQSEFWYDDETDGHWVDEEGKREYFMAANLKSLPDEGLARWDEERAELAATGCCAGDYEERPWVRLPPDGEAEAMFVFWRRAGMSVEDDPVRRRYLTPAELEGLREVHDRRRKSFEKRLAAYWRNHSDKVWDRGYWRNR